MGATLDRALSVLPSYIAPMRLPLIRGVIDRRVLVNYRVDPAVLAPLLPRPFEPKVVNGYAIGGICLIRLKEVRPRFVPRMLGLGSENAAHRFAVRWSTGEDGWGEGVYIPRRDTTHRLNALAGGRIFPGEHHHASFTVREDTKQYDIAMRSDDGSAAVHVRATVTDHWPAGSVFASAVEASAFFEAGSLGYSRTKTPGRFDGLELDCDRWAVTPLAVEHATSSYFDDTACFPPGSAELDCALLMHDIPHAWRGRGTLCCDSMTTVK